MKATVLSGLLSVILACSAIGADAGAVQKWNFIRGVGCDTAGGTEKLLAMLKDSKDAGCTHILLAENNMSRIPEQKPQYFDNVKKVLGAAKEMNLVIVPYLMHMGYSGRYLRDDGNMAAGLPVKDMLFVVKGDMAIPDPASVVDTTDLKESKGHLVGKLQVKPFHHYRISYYTKQKPKNLDEYLQITSPGRSHCRMFPAVTEDGESLFVQATFNSLDAGEVTFDLATTAVHDLKIEPAGLLLVVRRPLVPLMVASEDGKTVYVEGEDFKPVADPLINAKPFRGEIAISHQPAVIELTPGSRIRSGQKLRVSFWHTYRIRND